MDQEANEHEDWPETDQPRFLPNKENEFSTSLAIAAILTGILGIFSLFAPFVSISFISRSLINLDISAFEIGQILLLGFFSTTLLIKGHKKFIPLSSVLLGVVSIICVFTLASWSNRAQSARDAVASSLKGLDPTIANSNSSEFGDVLVKTLGQIENALQVHLGAGYYTAIFVAVASLILVAIAIVKKAKIGD